MSTSKYPYYFIIAGMAFLFTGAFAQIFFSSNEIFALARLAMGICFFGAFFLCYFSEQFKPEHRKYAHVFVGILIYVFLLSIPNFMKFYGVQGARVTIALEFAYFSMIAFGLVWLTLTYDQIKILLKGLLLASVMIFLFMIPKMDAGSVAYLENRNQALHLIREGGGVDVYTAQMSLAYLYAMIFLASFAIRMSFTWRFVAVFSLAFVLITAIYYSKRSTFLDLVVVGMLFVFVHGLVAGRFGGAKRIKFVLFVGLAGCAILSAIVFFGDGSQILVERLVGRFDEFSMPGFNIMEFSRIYEVRVWWSEASFLNKILGGGAIYYFRSGVTGEPTVSLHIGWASLYSKGGPPLLLYFLWIYWGNFKCAFFHRRRPSAVVGMTLPVFFGFAMIHSTVFGPLFAGLAVALSLFLYPALFAIEDRNQVGMYRPNFR